MSSKINRAGSSVRVKNSIIRMDENAMIPNHTISGKGDSIIAANPPEVVSPDVTMALPIREIVV